MPTLIRLFVILAVLAGLGYAALYALANFIVPEPREMTQTIPAQRFSK
jgi:phage shock protein PspC (stress-responsive transcriptional regulator)